MKPVCLHIASLDPYSFRIKNHTGGSTCTRVTNLIEIDDSVDTLLANAKTTISQFSFVPYKFSKVNVVPLNYLFELMQTVLTKCQTLRQSPQGRFLTDFQLKINILETCHDFQSSQIASISIFPHTKVEPSPADFSHISIGLDNLVIANQRKYFGLSSFESTLLACPASNFYKFMFYGKTLPEFKSTTCSQNKLNE